MKAQVTPVQVGNNTIDGLMDTEGTFYVAVPQVSDLFKTSRNTASRDFKRLLGASFKTSKLSAGLPVVSVADYDKDQLWTMNKAEIVYDAMRKIGKNHKEALAVI